MTQALAPSFSITVAKSGSNPTFNFDALPETIVLDITTREPKVIDGLYWCVYQTWSTVPTEWDFRLAHAASPSGPWTAYASNPILTRGPEAWEDGVNFQIYAPEIFYYNGTYYMFYAACEGLDGSGGQVGVATATAVTGPYTKYASNPILTYGTGTAWDSLRVAEPSVQYRDGTWYMAYMGETTTAAFGASEKLGMATAPSPFGPWTKYVNNPVIGFGAAGQWDAALAADPYLFHNNGKWWIWYAGKASVAPGSIAESGLAWADTPTGPWTRHASNPILSVGAAGTWDALQVFRGCIVQVAGTWHVIYAGFNAGAVAGRGGNATLSVVSSATTAGVWIDHDRDGFGSATADSDAPLARMMPEGSSSVEDNITAYVRRYTITRGAASEITGAAPIDSATIIVKNSTGYFSPDNTASPFYNRLGPGCPVWIGVNDDGTLAGTGHNVYGRFAGVVREIAPTSLAAGISAEAEIICDGILADYALTPVVLADSTSRSQGSFRAAVLTAAGEGLNRRDLDDESDPLPISAADSTNALSVLEELNRANGTRHFIAPANNRDSWYFYTTRNRHYKLGVAVDASLDAGAEYVTSIDGWRLNNDGIVNSQRATIDPISFSPGTLEVWAYEQVPFGVSGNQVIWANFSDYVANPTLSINVSSGSVTSSITPFGRSAKIDLYSAGATVSELSIEGSIVQRDSSITLTGDNAPETGPSQARYRVRAGSDLSGDLVGAQATAQGIVDHIVWRYAPRPLKRPGLTVVNWFPEMFEKSPYDVLGVTVDAVSAAAIKFDIVGSTETCDHASETGPVLHEITYQLVESRVQGTMGWFVLDSSTLDGSDVLGY